MDVLKSFIPTYFDTILIGAHNYDWMITVRKGKAEAYFVLGFDGCGCPWYEEQVIDAFLPPIMVELIKQEDKWQQLKSK